VKTSESTRFSTRVLSKDMHRLPEVDLCRRGEQRVERFLDAATEVFAEKGYQHAKLSEIVAKAGGSLATLYRVFGDKEGLVYAIVDRRLHDMSQIMNGLSLDGLPPEEALRAAAVRYAESMMTRETRLVQRMVIGEGHSFPALRDWYFENAVASLVGTLAQYLQTAHEAGSLRLHDTAEATATQFFAMLFGDLVLRTASGYLENPSGEAQQAYAQRAVETFLYGVLPR
jgi:AcrR family transcriptional regulator